MIYELSSLKEFCQIIDDKENVFLAAAGYYGTMVGEYLNHSNIQWRGYIDNSEEKQGKCLEGKEVYEYEILKKYSEVIVVICTIMRAKEIEDQLKNFGVDDKDIIRFDNRKIFHLANYNNLNPQTKIEKIKKLKNIANGRKRCFVIATGPSLTIEDLELLDDEFTISVNSIVECFSETKWRPNCYVAEDPVVYEMFIKNYGVEKLSKDCEYLVFAISSGMLPFGDIYDNMYFFNLVDESYARIPNFSEEFSEIVYESSTVIYPAIQLAFYMGFKEVYMLGADLGFSLVKNEEGDVEQKANKEATASFLKKQVSKASIYEEKKIIRGYRAAKKYADEHNLILKNATRGGYLNELERVRLEEVLRRR